MTFFVLRSSWDRRTIRTPIFGLIIKPEKNGAACPFVRKVRNQNRYLCTIYETRPKVCRNYVPWAPHTICEIVTD
jgi:Fe-S-cluster containining protein